MISGPSTSPGMSTRTRRSATIFVNSKPSVIPSPSSRRPDPHSTPEDLARLRCAPPGAATCPFPWAGHLIFGLADERVRGDRGHTPHRDHRHRAAGHSPGSACRELHQLWAMVAAAPPVALVAVTHLAVALRRRPRDAPGTVPGVAVASVVGMDENTASRRSRGRDTTWRDTATDDSYTPPVQGTSPHFRSSRRGVLC